jgi:CheY-like chemotaxis protein
MPQLDGYALARSVRERERARGDARRLPIIGITASIESEEPQRCRDAGMDDCLIKPAQLDLLYACLQKWLPETVMLSETWAVGDPARSAEIENLNVGIPASTDASLPPLNLEGLRQTMGSWSDVGTLLHVFVQSTEADISAFRILLRHPELAALREWHHRVAGSAMVLQYPPLLNALQAFRQGLEDEELERIQAKGNVLLDKLERFMSHLTSTRRTLTD